jgi:hypothetical protein
MDWQPIATAALGSLSAIIWWEVRQLRHAKHSNAQHIQYALICIALLAKKIGFDLPPENSNDE